MPFVRRTVALSQSVAFPVLTCVNRLRFSHRPKKKKSYCPPKMTNRLHKNQQSVVVDKHLLAVARRTRLYCNIVPSSNVSVDSIQIQLFVQSFKTQLCTWIEARTAINNVQDVPNLFRKFNNFCSDHFKFFFNQFYDSAQQKTQSKNWTKHYKTSIL